MRYGLPAAAVLLAALPLACGGSGDSAAQDGSDGGQSDGTVGSSDDASSDGANLLDGAQDGFTAADTGASEAGGCGAFHPDPGLAAKRAACAFGAGDKVSKTLDDATAARAAIKNLIIVAHENRAFDHMYGTLGNGFEGFPSSYANPTGDGGVAFPTHAPTACPPDITHSAAAIHAEWNDGGMNGFFETDGPESLWYYQPGDHPFFSWLMTTFAGSDRYFCSTLGHTGDNRRFLYGASDTQTAKNIFTTMDAAGVKWADYYAGASPIYNTYTWPVGYPNTHKYSQFFTDLDAGNLPPVTYLDTNADEHPPGSMKDGEIAIYEILQHAFKSKLWPHLAILFTYDEGGGFFDHIAPPGACPPSSAAADGTYTVLGIRVPLAVISPYARKGYVSHVIHSHTSTMRLVELLQDLPAVTDRDANSDALLDMFDFACPAFASPPALPPMPDGGCP